MRRNLLILPLILLAAAPLLADDSEEAAPPAWTGSTGLSFVATSGNSDTQTLGLDFGLKRDPAPWGWELKAAFLRAEQDDEKTAERYEVGGRAIRALNDRWDVFGGLNLAKDEFAGYDMRGVAEAGATYKALHGPEHKLSFDGGLTWTTEEFIDGSDNDFIGGLLGLSYAWQISENAAFTQRLIYYPNFDESSDWRGFSESALQAALSKRLALKVGFQVRYEAEPAVKVAATDTTPAEYFDDTDTTTTASLVLNF